MISAAVRSRVGRLALGLALALSCTAPAQAGIRVVDDLGRSLTLGHAARRIVSLAPHITEQLFSAGAGDRIVGTVAYSNYPPAAKAIPRVGDSVRLDLERIVALRPDLIVVWLHAHQRRQIEPLLKLNIPVYYDGPRKLSGIARSIEALGELAGTQAAATRAAHRFRVVERALRRRYADRAAVRVFYQLWPRPLMTVNRHAVISDVIRLCGGRNVFSALRPLVPVVSTESVLAADPQAIVAARIGSHENELARWKKWPRLEAVARGNMYLIPDDLISRPSARILDGARLLCKDLETARAAR